MKALNEMNSAPACRRINALLDAADVLAVSVDALRIIGSVRA